MLTPQVSASVRPGWIPYPRAGEWLPRKQLLLIWGQARCVHAATGFGEEVRDLSAPWDTGVYRIMKMRHG